MHHSDLLILDYHLDGEDDGICMKALNLLRYLADNKHFNIVAIHTKGYLNSAGEVAYVFRDVLVAMQQKPKLGGFPSDRVESALDYWAIDDDAIRSKLIECISDLQLLELLKQFSPTDICKGNHPFQNYTADFEDIYARKPEDVELNKTLLFKWLCKQKLDNLDGLFNSKSYEHFDWGMEGNLNWLKTDDLFVTVLGKKDTPINEIPDQVIHALTMWTPHPHKLILAKLRFEIEKHGISAAQNILNQQHLQAAWLKDLMTAKTDEELKSNTWNVVYKLWEQLAYEIKQNVAEFALDLISGLKAAGDESVILPQFVEQAVLNERNKQIYHANCFSYSKDVDSYHLTTGHILEIEGKYWLCLTPVCDLVPGQKSDSVLMQATMVKLQDAESAWRLTRESMIKALNVDEANIPAFGPDEITSEIIKHSAANNLIFLRVNDDPEDIKCFSFTSGIDGKAKPKSVEFYVDNQGVFSLEKLELIVYQSCIGKINPEDEINDEYEIETEIKVEVPVYKKMTAKVVSELRYEYALNLLGRLGFSRSRVGLDFLNS